MSLVLPPLIVGNACWEFNRTYLFGVVNVTPDSFSDGGAFLDADRAVAQGLRLAAEGADALDIGGESTRPRAEVVPLNEELARVLPVISALASATRVPISIDTYKAETARQAVAHGATIINDISGGTLDSEMARVVAKTGALYIAGHLRGTPQTMQENISFGDVVWEVREELRDRVRRLVDAGVRPDRIWVDPSVGFGKTAEQSMALIRAAGHLRAELGCAVMIGPSRKSFIGALTGQAAAERIFGSCAAMAVAVACGADAVRVHDVAQLAPALRVADGIVRSPLLG